LSTCDIHLVRELFLEVLPLDAERREEVLAVRCAGNERLGEEVRSLLRASESGGDAVAFIETSAVPGGLSGILADIGAEQAELPAAIGAYRVVRLLGEGGMGTVYEARQRSPDRRVALKVLRAPMASRDVLRRFMREAQILGGLQHPGIAQVYESGVYHPEGRPGAAQPYFVMEFVEGIPLSEHAGAPGRSTRESVALLALIADAVEHAHLRGVVHRDLKPANILVTPEGQPKVLDFGVARAVGREEHQTSLRTDVGQLIGTISYMSPEQVSGSSGGAGVDQRTDVYSLGVVLYELLTGRLPHDVRGSSIAHAAQRIISEEPPRMSSIRRELRGDLETITGKALEKDPARRYQSASELAADLRRYLANEPIAARPATAAYQLRKFVQRNTALAAGAGLAVAALALGAGISTFMAINESRLRQDAETSKAAAEVSDTAARRTAYRLALAAADAVGGTDPVKALAHLDAAPPELRGWEWSYLRDRFTTPKAVAGSEHPEDACSTAVARDGTPLGAVVVGGEVRLVDLRTARVVGTLAGVRGTRLTRPLMSDDAAMVVAHEAPEGAPAPEASPVVAFGPDRRERWRTPIACRYARLSPDGVSLAVESEDRRVVLYRIGDDTPVFDAPEPATTQPRARGFDCSFHRGCTELAVQFHDPVEYRTFDARSGARIVSPSSEFGGYTDMGDDRFATLVQRRIEIRDRATRRLVQTLQGHTSHILCVALSPDGSRIASASADRTIRVWDLGTGVCEAVISTEREVLSLRWHHDGRSLLAADAIARVSLLRASSGTDLVLRGHHTYVYHAIFSPDGRYIVSAGWKDEVRVWDSVSGDSVATLTEGDSPFTDPPAIVGFARGSSDLVVMAWSGEVREWTLGSLARVGAPRARESLPPFVGLMGTLEWTARRVCTDGGQCTAVTADATLIADNDGEDLPLLTPGGERVRTLHPGVGRVRAVAFSADGATLAAAGDDTRIALLDVASGSVRRYLAGHRAPVYTIAFSPDGSRIASGGNDNTIIIWDPGSSDPLLELRGHAAYVHAVSFSPDGRRLVSASGDTTVRVWGRASPTGGPGDAR
jgi:serine/threonine protein kinase/WD40 repeat protein